MNIKHERIILNAKRAMDFLKPTGVMVANMDDLLLRQFAKQCQHFCLGYGVEKTHFTISNLTCYHDSTHFQLNQRTLQIPLLSEVNAYNVTAAIVAGFVLDLNYEKILT